MTPGGAISVKEADISSEEDNSRRRQIADLIASKGGLDFKSMRQSTNVEDTRFVDEIYSAFGKTFNGKIDEESLAKWNDRIDRLRFTGDKDFEDINPWYKDPWWKSADQKQLIQSVKDFPQIWAEMTDDQKEMFDDNPKVMLRRLVRKYAKENK